MWLIVALSAAPPFHSRLCRNTNVRSYFGWEDFSLEVPRDPVCLADAADVADEADAADTADVADIVGLHVKNVTDVADSLFLPCRLQWLGNIGGNSRECAFIYL